MPGPTLGRGYNDLPDVASRAAVLDKALAAMTAFRPGLILIACNTLSVLYEPDRIPPGARGPRRRAHRGRRRPLSRSPDPGSWGHPRPFRNADDDRIGRARPQVDPERDRRPSAYSRLSVTAWPAPSTKTPTRPAWPDRSRDVSPGPSREYKVDGTPLCGSLLHALFLCRGYLPNIAGAADRGEGRDP